jgi:hypothetical protein
MASWRVASGTMVAVAAVTAALLPFFAPAASAQPGLNFVQT